MLSSLSTVDHTVFMTRRVQLYSRTFSGSLLGSNRLSVLCNGLHEIKTCYFYFQPLTKMLAAEEKKRLELEKLKKNKEDLLNGIERSR